MVFARFGTLTTDLEAWFLSSLIVSILWPHILWAIVSGAQNVDDINSGCRPVHLAAISYMSSTLIQMCSLRASYSELKRDHP